MKYTIWLFLSVFTAGKRRARLETQPEFHILDLEGEEEIEANNEYRVFKMQEKGKKYDAPI